MRPRSRNVLLPLVCAVVASSCTSLYPVRVSKDDAQQQIVSGQLLEPGDRVRLTTVDGNVHEFAITAIDTGDGTVKGARDSVRIADITTVARRRVSVGKTLGLVLGVVGGLVVGHDIAEVVTGHGD